MLSLSMCNLNLLADTVQNPILIRHKELFIILWSLLLNTLRCFHYRVAAGISSLVIRAMVNNSGNESAFRVWAILERVENRLE